MNLSDFHPWIERWRLTPDGDPFASNWSRLLPVRRDGLALMLKAQMAEQELHGSAFLEGYRGRGAVRVYEREGDAVLLERAEGPRTLLQMARDEGEEAAYAILCRAIADLQSASAPFPVRPIALRDWFSILPEAAAHAGGIYADAAAVLDRLLVTTQTQAPLHGDLHHGNLLDAGVRGWLAIDPKGLEGDPVFDYAIMLFVTEVQDGIAAPHQVIDRAQRVATMAQLPLERLLGWSLCVAAQYAGWFHGAPMGAGMLDAARVISEQSSVRGL
jgi:streptomycin 6-kinase